MVKWAFRSLQLGGARTYPPWILIWPFLLKVVAMTVTAEHLPAENDFTKAHRIVNAIEQRLEEKPDSASLVPFLHNLKKHLANLERSAVNEHHPLTTHVSLTPVTPTGKNGAASAHVKSEVEMINKFKGHKVIHVSDDIEGRLGNWTILKAMEKLLDVLPSNITSAERICRPGPLQWNRKTYSYKKCLILGDSISIGYYSLVSDFLEEECDVHHSPWGGDGGSLDTRYILQCLPMLLSSSFYEPTQYDAIVFNAGLHDVDCCNYSEYVPIKEYAKNLSHIKDILLKTEAKVAFMTSTPIPFNQTLNDRVVKYNRAAKRAMKKGKPVRVIDLYKHVTESCKDTSLSDCVQFQQQPNVHFTQDGYLGLADEVVNGFKKLLRHLKPRKKNPKVSRYNDASHSAMYCIKEVEGRPETLHGLTGCPVNTTCCINEFSNSLIGCCMLRNAMDCGDSWHCCPKGTVCEPSCTGMKCSCRRAPWESKASRIAFSLTMKSLNEFWKKITEKYPPLSEN